MDDLIVRWAREVQAIAQTGLAYSRDVYDKERYEQLLEIAGSALARLSDVPRETVSRLLLDEIGYATPKLDVRVVIVNQGDVLMVQERQDGLWSLPGGWADVNLSPRENAEKEVLEETGLRVKVTKLLALWDKLKHNHPPHWPHTYKCFFHADILSGALQPNHEILEVAYHPLDKLPPLSTHRVTCEQIARLMHLLGESAKTAFD